MNPKEHEPATKWIHLPFAIRYLGHGSSWSVNTRILGPREWHKDAKRMLKQRLGDGSLKAIGRWHPKDQATVSGSPTDIPKGDWHLIDFDAVRMTEIGMAFSIVEMTDRYGRPSGSYEDVQVDDEALKRLWPKWGFWHCLKNVLSLGILSFAERFGEIDRWRERNRPLDKDHIAYWSETRRII